MLQRCSLKLPPHFELTVPIAKMLSQFQILAAN